MSKIDETFQQLCNEILAFGQEYENKNRGVKRLQIPSYTLRHDFSDGFPAISNKKIYWKGIVAELIWFLRGDNNVDYLNQQGVRIWNKDAYNWYCKEHELLNSVLKEDKMSFEEFEAKGSGSVGKNYSVQWRNFQGVDQIDLLIKGMKKDIMSSRLKVNAWNPAEIFDTALPPCHSEFQVIGVPLGYGKFGFELHWNQRSVDTFLGLPFNIASYGLLAKILEHLTGYQAIGIEGTLKCVHFYDNQYKAVDEFVERDVTKHKNCELSIDLPCTLQEPWENFVGSVTPADFELLNYTSDKAIKVEMLAPKQ